MLAREKGIPFYLQLKNILKEEIRTDAYKSKRLPPVRQVAKDYSVSVNTVLRAYEELQKEGLITGNVGRGTFITTNPDELLKKNRDNLVKNMIKHALEEALYMGYSIKDFEQAVHDFVTEQQEYFSRVKIAFIECNIEQLLYFTHHLELDPSIHHVPILLENLVEPAEETKEQLESCDIILTSFYHMSEVENYLKYLAKPIIGINLVPEMSTIVEVAKVPPDSTVGIVTTSNRFKNIINEVLEELNLRFSKILETNSQDQEIVQQLAAQCDAVLVSPKRKQMVSEYARPSTKVIEFVFTPDRTSINNIKVAILELKKNQTTAL
ncbi:MAG: GntR family transcriptional regulator [Spirochaetota bacterium]